MRRREHRAGWRVAAAGLVVLVCAAAGACRGDSTSTGGAGRLGAGLSAPDQVASGRRLALVVGNDAYRGVPALRNAVNDARAVSAALEDVGFAVERMENTTQEALETALAAFAGSLRADDVALFYFAGHGMRWKA